VPPHRRWLVLEDLIRPSLRSEQVGSLVVAVDTSGSISQGVLAQFAAEVAKLAALAEEILVLTCDAQVHQVVATEEVPAFLAQLKFKGGGGTSHLPVFEHLAREGIRPDLFIGLTDLHSVFPEQAPPYPVLWCTTEEHGDPPPWGRVVVIPEES